MTTSHILSYGCEWRFLREFRIVGGGGGGPSDALAKLIISPLALERFICIAVYFVGKTRLPFGNTVLTISIYIPGHLVSIRGFLTTR
jgi:hypothetical protein